MGIQRITPPKLRTEETENSVQLQLPSGRSFRQLATVFTRALMVDFSTAQARQPVLASHIDQGGLIHDLKKIHVLLLVLFFAFAGQLYGQQLLGSITGTVTDSSGGVVPRVKVKIKNVATGLQSSTSTNGAGSYQFFDLPGGTYALTFTKDGFKTLTHSQVIVQGNRTATVEGVLQPGEVSTTVNVTATPLLNKVDTTTGYVVNQRTIQDTPLGTGSFTQLAIMSPGVHADFLGGAGHKWSASVRSLPPGSTGVRPL